MVWSRGESDFLANRLWVLVSPITLKCPILWYVGNTRGVATEHVTVRCDPPGSDSLDLKSEGSRTSRPHSEGPPEPTTLCPPCPGPSM